MLKAMFCKNCGTEITADARFCKHCGTQITEENICEAAPAVPAAQPNASADEPNVKKLLPAIITVAAVIALVCLIVFLVSSSAAAARCTTEGCTRDKSKGEYCSLHACLTDGCTRARSYGSYCASHVCLNGSCTSARTSGSIYCAYHYLQNTSSTSTYSSSSGNAQRDLSFTNIEIEHNSSYTVVTGKVKNNGSRTYKFVKIKGAFKNSSGSTVDTDWTYAVGSEGLAPGESTSFRMSVSKDYSIRNCSITITDYD